MALEVQKIGDDEELTKKYTQKIEYDKGFDDRTYNC